MLKKNILFFLILFSINSYVSAQVTNSFMFMSQAERRSFFVENGNPPGWSSLGNGRWEGTFIYSINGGPTTFSVFLTFTQYFIDKDEDWYGCEDDYRIYFYYEDTFGTRMREYGNATTTTTRTYTSLDSNDNFIQVPFTNLAYNLDGHQWVDKQIDFDCDDYNNNSPSGINVGFPDWDGDGHGNHMIIPYFIDCMPDDLVNNHDDCNDREPTITTNPVNWYLDEDRDGYGTPNEFILSCTNPGNYVLNPDDCDDDNPQYNNEDITWYADFDHDGFGDKNNSVIASCPPENYIRNCYFDSCPNEPGTRGNGCPIQSYDFENENKNYAYSKTYKYGFSPDQLNTATSSDYIEEIVYLDGFSKASQYNRIKNSTFGKDIITHYEYDDNYQNNKTFLPYESNNGNGIFDDYSKLKTFDYYNTAKFNYTKNPYSEVRGEDSPLNRVLETGAPGNDWEIDLLNNNRHTQKAEYVTNTELNIKYFSVSYIEGNIERPELVYNGSYKQHELSKIVLKNENWSWGNGNNHTTQSFTDRNGMLVLKRTFNSFEIIDTYYVYDSFGNLSFVITPEATGQIINGSNQIDQSILNELCYQHRYNYKGLIIWSKIPGKGAEEILYDSRDRQILVRDAKLAMDNKWIFNKYDALNRIVYTGIYTSAEPRNQIQDDLLSGSNPYLLNEKVTTTSTNAGGTNLFYTNSAFPNENIEILTVNYYDNYIDYNVSNGLSLPYNVFGKKLMLNPSGLPTVSKIKVLETDDWITNLQAYDTESQIIYLDSYNEYLRTRNIIRNDLDFNGNIVEIFSSHFKHGKPQINKRDYFYYDNAKRLLSHKQKIDNDPIQLIKENKYDGLGKLITKNVGGETLLDGYTGIENIDVSYNGIVTNTYAYSDTWQSVLKTKGSVVVGGVSCKVEEKNNLFSIGLIKPANSRLGNAYYDYGIYIEYNQVSRNHEIRVNIEGSLLPNLFGSCRNNDFFKIEQTVDSVIFYKNGTSFFTYELTNDPSALVGKIAFSGTQGKLTNLNLFGDNINKKLQKIDYKYNIRGWLTDINNVDQIGLQVGGNPDLFNLRLSYNNVQHRLANFTTPLYNGNISQAQWRTINDNGKRSYDFKYDKLSRIKDAKARGGNNLDTFMNFSIEGLDYDKNGNILSLKRDGWTPTDPFTVIDNLKYTYSGNKLIKIDDSGDSLFGFVDGDSGNDYEYDVNGNLIKDLNKNIQTIDYNYLNQPKTIEVLINNNTGTLSYIYDASGAKIEKKLTDTDASTPDIVIQYDGNYIYEQVGEGDNELKLFTHPEGYVAPTLPEPRPGSGLKSIKFYDKEIGTTSYSSYAYVFQHKDQLGNVRLSYSDLDRDGAINPSALGEIIEESNYYPFGMKHLGYNNAVYGIENNFQTFQGQELTKELDLNILEFKWRMHDPSTGRFWQIDPLANEYSYQSPYNFAENRVIDGYELEGLEWVDTDLYDDGELETVYLGDRDDKGRDRDNRGFYDDWTTELDQSGYNGDFEQWINGPGLGFSHDQEKAKEQWELAWGKAHRARESQLTRRQHNIDINNKLSFFTAPFVAIEDAYSVYTIYATMGIGSNSIFSSKFLARYSSFSNVARTVENEVFLVTKEGVVLPRGAKIPNNFIQNAYRNSNYGVMQNGKFLERLRIDPATPPGFKGPNQSHFHIDNGGHIFDAGKWPWW